ncbi:integral peroxisomal membrane peroxin-domain-containing protein [Blakeslea trispora]|nr:integral peroxisomal membrane peroxin-domain-containing protein [Blakeslea trispora]
MARSTTEKQSAGSSTALENTATAKNTHSFSSPHAIQTLDQIPVPALKLLVSLGPTLRLAAQWIDVLLWKTDKRRSVLLVLLWNSLCLWTGSLLSLGIPCFVLYRLGHSWLAVRTARKKREAVEKQRQEQRDKNKKREDDDEEDRSERDVLPISRKIKSESHVSLDDTLQDIEKVNQFVELIRSQWHEYTRWFHEQPVVFVLTVLAYASPVWWILCYLLGVQGILALVGSLLLLAPSGYLERIICVIQRNTVTRHLLAAIWTYGVTFTAKLTRQKREKKKKRGWKAWWNDVLTCAKQQRIAGETLEPTDRKKTSQVEMIFQFEIYENQRWWLGVNWTTNMMPSERTPWTDSQLKPITSKEDIQLPESTLQEQPENGSTVSKVWSWVDGDWWVDMTGELQNKVDHNGWEYGNNAWKQTSGTPGMQTFTRRRRWCRRARLVEHRMHVPEVADKVRTKGKEQIRSMQHNYPYLDNTLPAYYTSEEDKKTHLKRIHRLSKWLDNAVPHSPIPLGVDSLLGFIPLIGGVIGSIFALYQIYLSTLFGVPLWLVSRMLYNVMVDFLFTLVPLIGGILHMFYKTNTYNYQELVQWLDHPNPPTYADKVKEPSDAVSPTPTTITWHQLGRDVYQRLTFKKMEKKPE